MSNFTTYRSNEDELTSSSDEKMDTGSESFRSQDTPNSITSDFEDNPEVLRLQNPDVKNAYEPGHADTNGLKTEDFKAKESGVVNEVITNEVLKNEVSKTERNVLKNPEVLRLSKPDLNDSLTQKMLSLTMDSPRDARPRNLGISPPKFSSTLTLTTDHPLMGLGSPDDYPDLIPKKVLKDDEKDLSLSSIEDERTGTNGFYSPQRNTSKNNLYFSENFVTADSHTLNDSTLPPDVARVDKFERRKIKEQLTTHKTVNRNLEANRDHIALNFGAQSTPKSGASEPLDITKQEFLTGVAEWCESPSQIRFMPNFDLPIEMSSAIGMHDGLETPDVISSSTQEDRSLYQALLDPHTGSVQLRHTAPAAPRELTPRRKIMLPPEDDQCSLDSISASSMESEEEPPEPEAQAQPPCDDVHAMSDDDDTKRSKSTNTISYTSEPIPEYSLRDELTDERDWMYVPRAGQNRTCDVKVIEPYKRVLSHGGYSGAGAALIVFSACHLPDNTRHDYTYVMDNLFLYVIWTLERLVTEEYVLVYLHGSAERRRLPPFHWLHDCYKLIDRRLRKSLKHLYLVHPTFWLKSFVLITKPFVSSKFFKKLSYVKSLDELMEKVPVDPNAIPDKVKQYDATKKSFFS